MKFSKAVSRLGFKGTIRSAYLSYKHAGSFDSLVLHKNVITEISGKCDISIGGRFSMAYSEHLNCTDPRLGKSRLEIAETGSLKVGDGVAMVGPVSNIQIGGDFEMGDSFINSDCRIICADRIKIGDNCAISWNVEITDTDRHQIVVDGEEKPRTAPVEIEDGCWIGNNVLIKKGVTIGEGAVVASGSVVTNDIRPETLAGGVPAETIKEDVDWNR